MTPDPQPRTLGDELVRAAGRDVEQFAYIESLYRRVVDLFGRVGQLEADLATERTARERLELRLYAHELRDAGGELRAAGDDEPAMHSAKVIALAREYAPDTEPLPTTDEPELADRDTTDEDDTDAR